MQDLINVSPDICRICLKSGIDLRFEIEDCKEFVTNVAQIDLERLSDENMPNKVCNACFQMLVVANDIRSRCVSSKDFFDKVLQSLELKLEPTTVTDEELELYDFDTETAEETIHVKLEQDEEECDADGVLVEENFTKSDDEMHIEYLESEGIDLEIANDDEEMEDEVEYTIEEEVLDENDSYQPPIALKTNQKRAKSDTVKQNRSKKLRYGCCQCSFESAIKAEIKGHFNIEHAEKYSHQAATGHVCYLCNVGFNDRTEVLKHINAPRINNFQCEICEKAFRSEFKLKQHYGNEHPGQHSFACEFCDKVYDKQSTLNHHKYIQHDSRSVFQCSVCSKIFHRKSFFNEHMNAHMNIRNYLCPHCPAKFARRTNLQAHIRSHTGEKPYKCKHCPKSYSHCTDLKRHSYIHTQNWPFICVDCGKGFAKKSAVESHVKQHGVEGSYYTKGADEKEDKIITRVEEVETFE